MEAEAERGAAAAREARRQALKDAQEAHEREAAAAGGGEVVVTMLRERVAALEASGASAAEREEKQAEYKRKLEAGEIEPPKGKGELRKLKGLPQSWLDGRVEAQNQADQVRRDTHASLADIKAEPKLADLALVKQSRLSVVPVAKAEWKLLCKMAGVKP